MDIKEIALRIAESIDDGYFVDQDGWITEFAEALIAEIAKRNKPVVTLKSDDFGWGIWEDNLEHKPAGSILNLYSLPPTAEQIANETAEAIAAYFGQQPHVEHFGDNIAETIRSGAWKEFKK